jgi:hypothetical protein
MKLYSCYLCKKKKTTKYFVKDSKRNSGIASRCKLCSAKRDNKGRYQKRKEYFLEYQKNYRLKYPEKILARLLLKQAVDDGKIEKKNCQECGSDKTRGHHPDYSKPLEVIWLCQKHHQRLHQLLKTPPKE